jgi:iron complex outermembrane recepter protein
MTVVDVMKQAAAPRNLVGLAVSAIIAGVPLTITQTAHAQEASESTELEEVRVTGSRILRRDFESPSPIVTIGTEQLEQTSQVSLEASLNKLPQFVPALSQLITGDIQPTATNTPGAATANLRGLGANRNLVLLDGRRAMPINASLAIDLNTIPSAAIERVEVITGGASSTYGADAVGGVVNFILKKNFQGASFDAQYAETEIGDAQEYRISGVIGGNFGEGDRGNVMIGAEYTKRGDAFLVDREFYRNRYMDPTVSGTDFWWTETSYSPVPGNQPTQSEIDAIFTNRGTARVLPAHNFFLNDDGSLYASQGVASFGGGMGAPLLPTDPRNPGGTYRYNGPIDGLFRKRTVAGLTQNDLNAYVSTPLTRYSLFTRGSYEFNDSLSFFAQGTLSQNQVDTRSQFAPAITGWSAQIPHGNLRNCQSVGVINGVCQDGDPIPAALSAGGTRTSWLQVPTLAPYLSGGAAGLNCAASGGCTQNQAFPVSPELNRLLNSRPNQNGLWQLNEVFDWLPPRATSNDVTTYQIVAGFEGTLPVKDWTWEAYASRGQSSTNTSISGAVSLERYRTLVTSPNFGRGFVATQNAAGGELNNGIPQGGGFGGARVTCTSGLPIMENFQVSQDCIDALTLPLQNRQRLEQTVYEANLQGGIVDGWAGEIRGAFGASYRTNDFLYQTDGLTSINNFNDSAVGIFPLGDSKGDTAVREIYAEALVPLLADIPALQALNLELGYRYSDYSPSGPVSTYKGLLDWTVTDFLRIRGGHQFASRAPNIGELYSGRTQLFGGPLPTQDLCSPNSTRPLSVNPTANPSGFAAARALCEQFMGTAGATRYYTDQAATTSAAAAGLFQSEGNPNLKAEEAKTWTAGFVMGLPVENALLSGLRFTVDYYQIELEQAITVTTGDQIMSRCFSPQVNPGLSIDNVWCRAMQRDQTLGSLAVVNALFSNEAKYDVRGYDVQIDWRAALADMGTSLPGSLSLNIQASILDRFNEQTGADQPLREWKNFEGPNLTGNSAGGGGSFGYRVFTSLGYNGEGWGVSLRHRFLPQIQAADELNNPGAAGTGLIAPTPRYNIYDLSGTYSVTDQIVVRGGVDNLLDKDPPVTGRNLTQANGLVGGSLTTSGNGIYDPLGRRFYLGAQMNF